MYVNVITPQRILDYIQNLKRDMERIRASEVSGTTAVNILEFGVEQIAVQAKYMISDAFSEAVGENDADTLHRMFQFNPEYRLRAALAVIKIKGSELWK